MDVSNLPNKKFKEMVIRMVNKLWRKMEELSENFYKKYKKEAIRAEDYNN